MSILNQEYMDNIRQDHIKVILEKYRYQVTQYIDEEHLHLLANNLRLDVKDQVTLYAKDLAVKLFTWALSNRLIERSEEQVPLTWYDHFKLTFFPKWLLLVFPCKYRMITKSITYHKVCPHLNLKLDDQKQHFEFLINHSDLQEKSEDVY